MNSHKEFLNVKEYKVKRKGKLLALHPTPPRPLTYSLTLVCPPSSLDWVEPLLILYQSSNPQTVLGIRFMRVDCYAESRVQSPETLIQ